MEKDTRNAIERATQRARKLLEEDFAAQLEGDFDVHRDGAVAAKAGGHLSARRAFQRERIVAAIEHKRAAGMSAADAARDYLRDAAFTTLNRFVALKMLEARDLLQQCITSGEQSAGYREFCGMAPGLPLLPDSAGYRLYIESLFDELSTEVKVLFDRRDPSSVLWPKRATFEQLLEILNATELSGVWGEDETIGWVYQFFNGQDERKKMREESQAPRNSRELAVRNQFFTPRYVVQFLTDNTLGRIWYEMRGTKTALAENCEYMVRNPGEAFAPRAKKDPRDLRVLDPACGSGHFLLYAFDLLLAIYEEAYADPESPKSEATGKTLTEDYPSAETLRKGVPGLVLAHNLHGVDIDPRCAQIAQLALWMRAQRAYREFGIGRAERAQIRRSNIVVAEPLVADEQIAKEFVAKLGDAELGRVFTSLVESLSLAGDLGLLLRAEQLVARPAKRGQTSDLFAPPEERIRAALDRFVREETSATNTRRRLFADDATHGVALLSVAEKKFDTVLMNPPFGDASLRSRKELQSAYGASYNDLFAAFVERGTELLSNGGRLGAITSRTGFFVTSLAEWRQRLMVSPHSIQVFADLGEGVMDNAMVEAAAYVVQRARAGNGDAYAARPVFIRALVADPKEDFVRTAVGALKRGERSDGVFVRDASEFTHLREQPLVYWVGGSLLAKLSKLPTLEPAAGAVRKGLRTGDNFRFTRALWEVPPGALRVPDRSKSSDGAWVPLVMGGASQPWFSPLSVALNWRGDGKELRQYVTKYGSVSRVIQAESFYFRPGFSWTRRAVRFVPYLIPPGCIFTGSRPMAFPNPGSEHVVPAVAASRVASAFLRFYGEKFAWPNFLEGKVKSIPWPELDPNLAEALSRLVRTEYARRKAAYAFHEPFQEFIAPRRCFEMNAPGAVGDVDSIAFSLSSLLGSELEERVAISMGVGTDELRELTRDLSEAVGSRGGGQDAAAHDPQSSDEEEGEIEDDEDVLDESAASHAFTLLSYAVGVALGRWDVRIGREPGEKLALAMTDAWSLGAVPPAMLLALDGTPLSTLPIAQRRLSNYPLGLTSTGLLLDDEGHPHDICKRVTDTFAVLFGDAADAELDKALRDVGADDLRGWLRGDFFPGHLKRYTRAKRKAPLYVPLGARDRLYGGWLYLHAASSDTAFALLNEHVVPRLQQLEAQQADDASASRSEIKRRQQLVSSVREFADGLRAIAPLFAPSMEDGAIVACAPLATVIPDRAWRKACADAWKKLSAGDYDWAHLAMHLWPERVVPKCANDRSLAIAHGLDDVFWVEGTDGKWTARKTPTRSIDELVRERTSPAVKSALKSLLEAPAAAGKSGGRRGGGRRKSTAAAEGGDG